jgi:hypothetical protein
MITVDLLARFGQLILTLMSQKDVRTHAIEPRANEPDGSIFARRTVWTTDRARLVTLLSEHLSAAEQVALCARMLDGNGQPIRDLDQLNSFQTTCLTDLTDKLAQALWHVGNQTSPLMVESVPGAEEGEP